MAAERGLELKYTKPQLEIFFGSESKYTIVTKGRRFGATKGAANAFIEWAIEGITPMLWVDTINSNIDRYVERYFFPELHKLRARDWQWQAHKKILRVFDSVIDFRSADAPESIEGFGYKKIFLNEAGIILKDDYLYSNVILPMLLDYDTSQLFAIGVPKGKMKRDGTRHKFFELYSKAKQSADGYRLLEYTSYHNPLIAKNEIDLIAAEMSDTERQQEIFGQFVEYTGENPFAHNFNADVHVSSNALHSASRQLVISVDFNLNPFGVIFCHVFREGNTTNFVTFDEAQIPNGSIPKMVELIRERYNAHLHSAVLTGDAMGTHRTLLDNKASSYYQQLARGLGMKEQQIKVAANPTHENSRSDCNYVLWHSTQHSNINVTIHPTCKALIADLKGVQCDAFGQITKRNRKILNQRADMLDCWRYVVNLYLRNWIVENQKHYGRLH